MNNILGRVIFSINYDKYICFRAKSCSTADMSSKDFFPLLNCFSIRPIFKKVKKLQANYLVDQLDQVIYYMLVTNYIGDIVFYCV